MREPAEYLFFTAASNRSYGSFAPLSAVSATDTDGRMPLPSRLNWDGGVFLLAQASNHIPK